MTTEDLRIDKEPQLDESMRGGQDGIRNRCCFPAWTHIMHSNHMRAGKDGRRHGC